MKRVGLLALVVVLCAACAAGCGQSADQKSVADYLEWTGADWDAASAAEKTEVAEKVVVDIGESMVEGFSTMVEEAKSNEATKAEFDSQINNMKDTMTAFFKEHPDSTIDELMNQSTTLIDNVLN